MLPPDIIPEHRPDSFRIENSYNPSAVFALLTRDYKSHSVTFNNNWKQLIAPEYDPIGDISVIVRASLAAGHEKGADRFQKALSFEACFGNSDNRKNFILGSNKERIEEFQKALYQQGIDADFVRRAGVYRNEYTGHFAVKADDVQVRISGDVALLLYYPHSEVQRILVDTEENFVKHYKKFFDIFEKTLKAAYVLNGQDFPPQILHFKEAFGVRSSNRLSVFLVNCSFCKTDYMLTYESADCPHCGGAKPAFY